MEGIPFDDQRIMYDGRQLCDEASLFDYDIQDEDWLYLFLKQRGD